MIQKDKIISSIDSGTFLNLLYSIAHDDEITMSLLIEMHNSGEINIVKECAQASRDSKEYDFFLLRFKFEDLLPSLNASIQEVMDCVYNLIAQAGDDLASHHPVTAFKYFCKRQEGIIDEALNLAVKEYSKYHEFIFWLLSVGVEMDFDKYIIQIKELFSSSVIEHKVSAVASIKTIDFSGRLEVAKELFFIIKKVLDVDENNHFRSNSLDVLLNLYSLNLDIQDDILQEISYILQSADERILHNAVYSYLRVRQSANLELRSLLFEAFININPQNKRTINILDSVLRETLSGSVSIEGVNFIENYLLKHEDFRITDFNSSMDLILRRTELINYVITRWFLSKKYILCIAVEGIFSLLSSEGIPIGVDSTIVKNPHENPYAFLARKAIGWLFMYPQSMVSYLYSLLPYANNEEMFEIAFLLFNKVLLNYPSVAQSYLASKIEQETDVNINDLVNNIIKEIETYFNELQSSNQLKELRVSEECKIIYQNYHSTLMRESMKRAEEHSIFKHIATKQLILYGNKTVTYFGISEIESTRTESELKPCGFSRSFPVLGIIDPTGLEYDLLFFKTEECV